MLKYVVASTGHSGTKYTAKLLHCCKLTVVHEYYFGNADGSAKIEHKSIESKLDAIVGGFNAPFLEQSLCAGAICIHQVRNPVHVVRSWVHDPWGIGTMGGFFAKRLQKTQRMREFWPDPDQQLNPGQFRIHCKEMRNHNWLTCMWIAWNRYIARQRPEAIRYRVEDSVALLETLGLSLIVPPPQKNVGKSIASEVKDFELEGLSNRTKSALYSAQEEHGYPNSTQA